MPHGRTLQPRALCVDGLDGVRIEIGDKHEAVKGVQYVLLSRPRPAPGAISARKLFPSANFVGGSSHRELSERIVERLGMQLGEAALGKFSNGEKSVEISRCTGPLS